MGTNIVGAVSQSHILTCTCSLPSTACHVSASTVAGLVILFIIKLLRCIGSGLLSVVGLISANNSRSTSFVYPSVLVVFKWNGTEENRTKKCWKTEKVVP